jgi:signal transduction histidine kinase
VLSFEDITRGAREAEQRRMRERTEAVHDLGESLAHEIRNPLNALTLNLQLLRECLDDEGMSRDDLHRRAEKMLAESKRLELLVTHLLEVSRGGALQLTDAHIDPIVQGIVDRLEGLARTHDCRVTVRAGSTRGLRLDQVRIDRALENVVRNAIEAAAEGGHHVWISTRDDPHSTIVIVEDDGPGISPQDFSQVFVLYSTGKRGGTGLGLPLAREDVRRHGGEIEAKARHGGGAQFLVYLPERPSEPDLSGPNYVEA